MPALGVVPAARAAGGVASTSAWNRRIPFCVSGTQRARSRRAGPRSRAGCPRAARAASCCGRGGRRSPRRRCGLASTKAGIRAGSCWPSESSDDDRVRPAARRRAASSTPARPRCPCRRSRRADDTPHARVARQLVERARAISGGAPSSTSTSSSTWSSVALRHLGRAVGGEHRDHRGADAVRGQGALRGRVASPSRGARPRSATISGTSATSAAAPSHSTRPVAAGQLDGHAGQRQRDRRRHRRGRRRTRRCSRRPRPPGTKRGEVGEPERGHAARRRAPRAANGSAAAASGRGQASRPAGPPPSSEAPVTQQRVHVARRRPRPASTDPDAR